MKLLIDTNVFLDIILSREPFTKDAVLIWKIIEKKFVKGYISATTITDIHYISKKSIGDEKSKSFIKEILDIFEIIDADKQCFYKALNSTIKDFEDAVQYEISEKIKCDYIVTRNKGDYKDISNVLGPGEFLAILK